MSTLHLCRLHDAHESEHWTGSPVGFRVLDDNRPTGEVLTADRECARRNITDQSRIVDVQEVSR